MGFDVIDGEEIPICFHYQFTIILQVDHITHCAVTDLFGTISLSPFFDVFLAGGGDFELDEGTVACSWTTVGASSSSAGLGMGIFNLRIHFSGLKIN